MEIPDIVVREINYSHGDIFKVLLTSDWHLGSASCDRDFLEYVVEYARGQCDMWMHLGDVCDSIYPHPSESRLDLNEIDRELLTPDEQYKEAERLMELMDNGIVIISGNHDYTLYKRSGHNYVRSIAEKLGIEYGYGNMALVRLKFVRQGKHTRVLDFLIHHGWGSSRRRSKDLKMEDLERMFDVDIYAMGHLHCLGSTVPKTILYPDKMGYIRSRVKRYYYTGGFLKGYTPRSRSYVKRSGLPPTILGSLVLYIEPECMIVEDGCIMEIGGKRITPLRREG